MKLADLSLETRQSIAKVRFDLFTEKHEGPWPWKYWLEDERVEFLQVDGFHFLLPVAQRNHKNITILRYVAGESGQFLTIFLQDTTYDSGMVAGRIAICERVPNEQWYLGTFYHEWYITEPIADQL